MKIKEPGDSHPEAKLWQKSFYALGSKEIVLELNKSPNPFVDWALVEAGSLAWLNDKNEKVPLDGEPSVPAGLIHSVPLGVPSGIVFRTQRATKGEKLRDVLGATYPWERTTILVNTLLRDGDLYRLWYDCDRGLAYAESEDLVNWHKPLQSVVSYETQAKTNLTNLPMREGSVFIDPNGPRDERYKAVFTSRMKSSEFVALAQRTGKPVSPTANFKKTMVVRGAVSADGIAWRELELPLMLHFADTQTVAHFDSSINEYVAYTRTFEMGRRSIGRTTTQNFRDWPLPISILRPGPGDAPYSDFYLNACAFYPGQPDLRVIFCLTFNRNVENSEIRLASSRDGHVWHWTPGGPVLTTGESGEWDSGFLGVFSSFVRTKDNRMAVLYTGYNLPHKFPRTGNVKSDSAFAYWEADRLVALEAPDQGEFTTYQLQFRGGGLIVNAETDRAGEIRIQVHDSNFRPVAGKTFDDCDPIFGDHRAKVVTWRGQSDLSEYRDRFIYLTFRMRTARLFSISAA